MALRVSDWWLDHLPEGQIAFWDFDDPAIPDTNLDTSATAIAAAALLKLSALVPERAACYGAGAERMAAALIDHLTPIDGADERPPGMLLDACYNHRLRLATHHELIWGDYFLLEAARALSGALDTRGL
jgi:unsaturated chondroitin disaccharide hydrolase